MAKFPHELTTDEEKDAFNRLRHVGFSPAQAYFLVQHTVGAHPVAVGESVQRRWGFGRHQRDVLAGTPTMESLMRQAKFTRVQAQLVLDLLAA